MTGYEALVSIIVPVYGTEVYLPACIESLRNQSYPHIEIILVDDQSPDTCPEICDRYAQMDDRIIVIHQENKGVSGARNTGMCHASGEYIMFVDSDDEMYQNAVEIMVQDATRYHADTVSALQRIVSKDRVMEDVRETDRCVVYQGDDPILLSLQGDKNTVSACAKLFKTSFIQGISFEEGKNINEDGFFVFRCYGRKPRLVQHNVYVYQYNLRQDSNSRQRFSDKYLSMLYFCERKKEFLQSEFPLYVEQRNNMEVRTNLELLQVMCSNTEKKYKHVQKECIKTVRRLYAYHKPIHSHHKMLAWIIVHGLYPLYKLAVRLKYYR